MLNFMKPIFSKEKNKPQVIAELVSLVILNPAFLGIIILVIGVLRSKMSQIETLAWLLGVLTLNGLIPILFYLFFTKKGHVFDDTLDNPKVQKERIGFFMIFICLVSGQLLILASTKQYQPLLAILSGGLIALIMVMGITYFWKISLHSGMTTIFVLMLIYLYGIEKIWPSFFLIPLVFWSRIVLFRHTLAQLLGGIITACLVVLLTYLMFVGLF